MQYVTVHPFDPWGSKVGGIEAFIRLMLRHAPSDSRLALVGVSENPAKRPLRRWQKMDFEGRELNFYAVAADTTPNRRGPIPLFLRFPLRLRLSRLSMPEAVAIYHRPEPAAFGAMRARASALFIHADPREWVSERSEVKWRYAPWLYRYVESGAIRQSSRVFCVNRSAVETLRERYPNRSESIRFTPTTYRDDLFYPPTPNERRTLRERLLQSYGIGLDIPVVIFSGRLERQKNPLLALEAYARLRRCRPACLVVIGDGALRDEMESALTELKLRETVFMLGALSPERVADWLRAGDLFLMTSLYEGMPIALLEAQACGLPAVAANVGEVGTIIQEGLSGLLVNSHSAEAYSNAMDNILSRDFFCNMETRAAAVAPFRPSTVFESLYEEIDQLGERP